MEYKILLQMKYYNCVRDKTKGYVFGLGVVFDVFLSEYESSIYSTRYNNVNGSLNTELILNNE